MRFVCAVVVGWAAFSLAGCGEGLDDDDDDLDPDLQTQLSNVRQFIKAREEETQNLQEHEESLWLQEQKQITCATVKEQERKRRDVLFLALEQQLDFTRKCGDVSLDEGGEMSSTNNNTKKQWGSNTATLHTRTMDSWTQHKCHYDHKERGYQKTIDPGILGLPRLKAAACDLWIRVHESSITKAVCYEDPTLSKEHQQQAEDYLKMINKIRLPEQDKKTGNLEPLPECQLPQNGPNQRQTSGRRGGSRRNARGFASARVEAGSGRSLSEVENVSMASRANANATAASATVNSAQSPGSWFQSFSLKTARDASNENAVRGVPPKRPKRRDEMSRRAVATNPEGALGRL